MVRKSISQEKRWQIIGMWQTGTLNNNKIADRAQVSEKCVRTTIKNFQAAGTANETPKCGRPKKFSDQDERFLIMKSRQNPSLSLRNLAEEFNSIKKIIL